MNEARSAAPSLGSMNPDLPPPLPPQPPPNWDALQGALPDAKPRRYTAQFAEILQPTPDVRLFRLTLDGYREIMPFIAGQFIQMITPLPSPAQPAGLETAAKSKELIRSYSIASAPEEKRFLEFCIKLVMHGAFTPALWDMRPGDRIDIRGPYGKFIVSQPVEHDIVCIAAGTGIAPFWGMIQSLLFSGCTRDILLLFGVRYEEDWVYRKEFLALAARYPNFRPVFTLSRPRHPETWDGETGYVQSLLAKYLRNPAQSKAFICGLTPMIDPTVAELKRLGVSAERIHYERYD